MSQTKSKKLAKVQMVDSDLIKTDTMGINIVGVINQSKVQRTMMLADAETLQKTYEYIFGTSEENPLKDITDDVNQKLNSYETNCNSLAENIQNLS